MKGRLKVFYFDILNIAKNLTKSTSYVLWMMIACLLLLLPNSPFDTKWYGFSEDGKKGNKP
jgi:hypothetical protein